MYSELNSIVEDLKIGKNLYFSNNSYFTLSSYLEGYLAASWYFTKTEISWDFQKWLQNKVGKHFAVTWSHYVIKEMSGNNEEKAYQLLLDLFSEFLSTKINENA